jgi:hypothetical protein
MFADIPVGTTTYFAAATPVFGNRQPFGTATRPVALDQDSETLLVSSCSISCGSGTSFYTSAPKLPLSQPEWRRTQRRI